MCSAKGHVRFTPNSDVDCVFRHVCFGPKADIAPLHSITSWRPLEGTAELSNHKLLANGEAVCCANCPDWTPSKRRLHPEPRLVGRAARQDVNLPPLPQLSGTSSPDRPLSNQGE